MNIGIKTLYNAVSKRHLKHLVKYGKYVYNKVNYCTMNCDLLSMTYAAFRKTFEDDIVVGKDGKERLSVDLVISYMNKYHRKKGCYVQLDNLRLAIILESVDEFRKNKQFGEVKKIWLKYSDLLSAKSLKMCDHGFKAFLNSLDLDTYRTRLNKYINFEDFCEKIDYRPGARRYQV